jgi:hypothetical protein
MFAMISMGAKVNGSAHMFLRLVACHRIGSMLPSQGPALEIFFF